MDGDEEGLLHSAALQNARSILLARQRAEQELKAKSEALAEALALTEASLLERDRARAEADEARRAAQSANEAKSRFLNMISHELRTPLGAIGGFTALLEEEIHGPLTDEQRTYIARIRYNQAHLLQLVNELLDLAKIESGHFALSLETVAVRGVIEGVCTMIEPQIQASGLRMETDSGDSLYVHADRDRVEQILLNLLSNAIKFTETGTVKVTGVQAADKVCLRVQDTGIGIPAEQLEAVFEAFVQVDASQTRTRGGTGLGLAISRDLARAMNGDLTVESTLGEGSTFTLSLPRAPTPAALSALRSSPNQ